MTAAAHTAVTQADRDAAGDFWASLGQRGSAQKCRDGRGFRFTAEHFARHREATTADLQARLDASEAREKALRDVGGGVESLLSLIADGLIDGLPYPELMQKRAKAFCEALTTTRNADAQGGGV